MGKKKKNAASKGLQPVSVTKLGKKRKKLFSTWEELQATTASQNSWCSAWKWQGVCRDGDVSLYQRQLKAGIKIYHPQ